MKVIFFQVDDVLNFPESDAIAPSGKMGIADSKVKELKKLVTDSNVKIVLVGKWKKDWDFDDKKCTPDGVYLNKKLGRKGLHILDKTNDTLNDAEGISDWITRHPNVTDYLVLTNLNEVEWQESRYI